MRYPLPYSFARTHRLLLEDDGWAVTLWHAGAPAPFDLEALFRSLGVERKASGVTLDDAAPLAWVRHAIFERGSPSATPVRGN